MPRLNWTPLEIALLRRLYSDTPTQLIADQLGRKLNSVYAKAKGLGLQKSEAFAASVHSGRIQRGRSNAAMQSTQFRPGQKPWNTGTSYFAGGRSAETQFKKGFRPHTWMPVPANGITSITRHRIGG